MTVQFSDIEEDFGELRGFILNDVDRIVSMEIGGNYAAAALIACAYEALAQLRGVAKHGVFAENLPTEWLPVAQSLYDALRNGIVHGYATKAIVIDGRQVEIGVSWREQQHLSLDRVHRIVFLNVAAMADHLRHAFEHYEALLRSDTEARERFVRQRRRGRDVSPRGDELAAWKVLLDG